MLIFFKRTLFFLLAIFITLTLSGCMLLLIPTLYLYKAGDGEKDLSHDFARGHVVGKEYETTQTFYITQYDEGDEIFLKTYRLDYIIDEIPPKTRFKVCKVLASTSFGSELCCQHILATLVDEHDIPIITRNIQGKPSLIYVSYLFKDTFQMPNQNWVFKPKNEFIQEIHKSSD